MTKKKVVYLGEKQIKIDNFFTILLYQVNK